MGGGGAMGGGAIVRAVMGGVGMPDTPTGGGAIPEAVIDPDDMEAGDLGGDDSASGGADMGGATVAVMVADMAGAASRSGEVRSGVAAGPGRVSDRGDAGPRSGSAAELALPLPGPARPVGLGWPAAEVARMAAASSGSGASLTAGGTG